MCGSCLNKCISVALDPSKQKFLAPPLSVRESQSFGNDAQNGEIGKGM